jgi:predicted flap endonuclease-1-like 5' DNA nuclease
MIYLVGEIWLWLLPAFLLGLLVGWWIWGNCAADGSMKLSGDTGAIKAQYEKELAACREQQAKLSAENARLKGASGTAAMALAAPLVQEKMPTFLDKPIGAPDDLKLLKGVGEKLNTLLNNLGVYHFRQIAGWTAEDIALVDSKLEQFKGRIVRDEWVAQARLLAEGNMEEFRRRYGEPGSEHA